MSTAQKDIRDFLGEIQQSSNLFADRPFADRIGEILRHFHAGGLTLAVCADSRHLNRALSTCKAYARDLSLAFPDYVPRHMKPKKEPKAPKRKKKATP